MYQAPVQSVVPFSLVYRGVRMGMHLYGLRHGEKPVAMPTKGGPLHLRRPSTEGPTK